MPLCKQTAQILLANLIDIKSNFKMTNQAKQKLHERYCVVGRSDCVVQKGLLRQSFEQKENSLHWKNLKGGKQLSMHKTGQNHEYLSY